MTFKRFLYILGQGPRIFRLIRELYRILVESSDERLLEYLKDVENVSEMLKKAKTHEERSDIAVRISDLLRRL